VATPGFADNYRKIAIELILVVSGALEGNRLIATATGLAHNLRGNADP
jgi:hypothetical protein